MDRAGGFEVIVLCNSGEKGGKIRGLLELFYVLIFVDLYQEV